MLSPRKSVIEWPQSIVQQGKIRQSNYLELKTTRISLFLERTIMAVLRDYFPLPKTIGDLVKCC